MPADEAVADQLVNGETPEVFDEQPEMSPSHEEPSDDFHPASEEVAKPEGDAESASAKPREEPSHDLTAQERAELEYLRQQRIQANQPPPPPVQPPTNAEEALRQTEAAELVEVRSRMNRLTQEADLLTRAGQHAEAQAKTDEAMAIFSDYSAYKAERRLIQKAQAVQNEQTQYRQYQSNLAQQFMTAPHLAEYRDQRLANWATYLHTEKGLSQQEVYDLLPGMKAKLEADDNRKTRAKEAEGRARRQAQMEAPTGGKPEKGKSDNEDKVIRSFLESRHGRRPQKK